jgi:hypothetical protein
MGRLNMARRVEKERMFRSFVEFEKEYFPKSFERKRSQAPEDPAALGTHLAKESLEKIRAKLLK